MSEKPAGNEHAQRDAESLWALGIFLVVLSLPVFVGMFFEDDPFARFVDLLGALAIGIIGALMIWRGVWIGRHRT